MRLSILRSLLCWVMVLMVPVTLLGQAPPPQAAGAILHTQGGVWVNNYEARDSSAIFAGDVIETKTGATANLSLDGSTVLIAPESLGKFQGNLLELDHGSVSVGTSKTFKVRVKCILVVPVLNEWTQYAVTDVNGSVQVAASKNNVNVEHEAGPGKTSPENSNAQRADVHEGEQKSYDETEVCGAVAPPSSVLSGVSPKLIAAGAAGVGVLILLIIQGGGSKSPVSPSAP